jgi:hypothetical protein
MASEKAHREERPQSTDVIIYVSTKFKITDPIGTRPNNMAGKTAKIPSNPAPTFWSPPLAWICDPCPFFLSSYIA